VTVATAKGDKWWCDELVRRIIRQTRGPMCERCGVRPGTDTAHIIGRRYSATRCVEANLWLLDGTCHHSVDEWPDEKLELAHRTIGEDAYWELKRLSQAGPPLRGNRWWSQERERLTERCAELGIDTRRRVPT
jgi:5-methylcytosine-specific restriction endonuclease McrA